MKGPSRLRIVLDAGRSPAQAIPPDLLRREPLRDNGGAGGAGGALRYDATLRWLMASDRLVGDQVSRALIEVKERRLYEREGHARWSTYLRAFVPLTARWSQYEMKRARDLRDYPALAAAWSRGQIGKSHLRAILRVVTSKTEVLWCERGRSLTVRQIEALARQERRRAAEAGAAAPAPVEDQEDREDSRSRRRVVMAPPGVAVRVAEAVDLARKLDGYQVGVGQAVAMMAMETMSGLTLPPDPPAGANGSADIPAGVPGTGQLACTDQSLLGDGESLRKELGRGWSEIHRQMEEITRRWSDLPWDPVEVVFEGTPPDDADPHERVVFWSAAQGRLDAVRGRLLRIVQDRLHVDRLGFAGLGQYVRERMGVSLREAEDLIRLDRALRHLPVAFRMYAAGRLGKRAGWLVSKVAVRATDRAWTHFAMTHTLRLLEASVEVDLLRREVDADGWTQSGGLPPEEVSFAEATRACSLLKAGKTGQVEATARIRFVLDAEQQACYEQTLAALRASYGQDRPEWWCLAVMAQHFLNLYADFNRGERHTVARRVLERDNYTCAAPECLQRGGLECDHAISRAHGGKDALWNLSALCAAEHRHTKHTVGSLVLYGEAPDSLMVRMGGRVYRKDRIVSPKFDAADLDADPWATEARKMEPPASGVASSGA